jgi:hypothetical protein
LGRQAAGLASDGLVTSGNDALAEVMASVADAGK